MGGEETPPSHLSERSRTCAGWHELPLPFLKKQTQHFYGISDNIYHSYDFLMQGTTQMRWGILYGIGAWVVFFFFYSNYLYNGEKLSNLNVAALSILQLY